MATNANYAVYRKFLEEFAASVDPSDQLPVRVAGYTLAESELTGEIMDWTYQYLADKKCPPPLVTPIVLIIVEEMKQTYRKTPEVCGYNADVNAYQPLKLMQTVIAKINDVCQRLLDNAQLDMIPAPPSVQMAPPRTACSAVKNTRRKMEDRHVCIDDFNTVFGIANEDRASYYAVFDGHAGVDAATYAVSHLHCHLAASPHYPARPAEAMRDAFHITDTDFLRKCEKQKLCSGTTALSVLYRPAEQRLYCGWLGDSKALLVTQGTIMQLVQPHKPELPAEKERINRLGGAVMMYGGLYRVNGSLAVSRAIGDPGHRPFVSGEPDIVSVPLSGKEDFLVLGCDGLWDYVTEDDVAWSVYKKVREDPDNIDLVTKRLVDLAIVQGSSDNISVIVVFLKDPHQISEDAWPSAKIPSPLDNMETAYDNNTNGASAFNNSNEDIFQKSNLLHDFGLDMNCKAAAATDAAATDASNNANTTNMPGSELLAAVDGDGDNANTEPADETQAKPIDFIFGNPLSTTTTNGKHADVVSAAYNNGNISHNNGDGSSGDGVGLISDFGPETDVDAVDEPHQKSPAASNNPLQEQHEQFFSEFNTKNQVSDDVHVDVDSKFNPFELVSAGVDNKFSGNELLIVDDDEASGKRSPVDSPVEPIVAAHDTPTGEDENEGEEAIARRLTSADFSEKKEYSFEREEYEKEIDSSLADLPSATEPEEQEESNGFVAGDGVGDEEEAEETAAASATSDEQLGSLASDTAAAEDEDREDDGDLIVQASPPLDSSAEDNDGRIVDEKQPIFGEVPQVAAAMTVEDLAALTASDDEDEDEDEVRRRNVIDLPAAENEPSVDLTAAEAENVAVPESGEDSEDEWNYINVKNEDKNSGSSVASPQPPPPQTATEPQEELLSASFEQVASFEHEIDNEKHTAEDDAETEAAAEPIEETAGLAEQSHAVSQALVEPQELISELSEQTGAAGHEDILDQHASADNDDDKSSEIAIFGDHQEDEEDMDFQLNPEAKEFVPTSPIRTPSASPFHDHAQPSAAGQHPLHRPNMLIDDDCLLAQSPRKGGVPMENILLPTEHEFDDEISHRPAELEETTAAADLLSPTLLHSNGSGGQLPAAAAQNGDRPGSSGSTYSYQEMNLKEAMHGDEKLDYAPEPASFEALSTPDGANNLQIDELSAASDLLSEATTNEDDAEENNAAALVAGNNERFLLRESDPMSMSFYDDGGAAPLGGNNPFAVDMNAVQMLPQEDDDEEEEETQAADAAKDLSEADQQQQEQQQQQKHPYHFDGVEGEHFVIQDTEFGMNNGDEIAANGASLTPLSPINDAPLIEQFSAKDSAVVEQQEQGYFATAEPEAEAVESDRPEADVQSPTSSSIVQLVQQMATEATSPLADVEIIGSNDASDEQQLQLLLQSPQSDLANGSGAGDSDELLSETVTASPVDGEVAPVAGDVEANNAAADSPTAVVAGDSFEELAESEQNYSSLQQQQIPAAAEAQPPAVNDFFATAVAGETVGELMQQTLRPVVGDALDLDASLALVDASGASVAATIEKTDAEAASVVEAATSRLLTTGTATAATAAVVATAAVAAVAAAAPKPAAGARKTTTPLKVGAAAKSTGSVSDAKSKASSVAAARKPLAAPSIAARSSVAASKTAASAKPAAAAAARTKPTVGSTTTRSVPSSAAASKSAATSTTSTTAAKRPLTNGTATKSTTSLLTAARKPAAASSSAASATTAARTAASLTSAARSATAKPAVAARSSATSSATATSSRSTTVKSSVGATATATTTKTITKTTTTSRAPISSRPTTTTATHSSTSSSTLRPATGTAAARSGSLAAAAARSSPSSKPLATGADKTATAAAKLSAAPRGLSATSASPRSVAPIAKRTSLSANATDVSKSPSAVRQSTVAAARTSAASAASATKRPTPAATTSLASAATKKPTLSHRVSLAPTSTASAKQRATATTTTNITSGSSAATPIKKRVSAPAGKSATPAAATKTTAAGVAAPVNGDSVHKEPVPLAGDGQLLDLDGQEKFDLLKPANGHAEPDELHANTAEDNSNNTDLLGELQQQQQQQPIIDLSAD